jgi:hypothetical protein
LEIAVMTKTLTLAALFFVGSIAATASLLHEPSMPGHATTADSSLEATRRGTRAPLAGVADAEPTVGTQPRRGERAELDLAGDRVAEVTADSPRRGTRL